MLVAADHSAPHLDDDRINFGRGTAEEQRGGREQGKRASGRAQHDGQWAASIEPGKKMEKMELNESGEGEKHYTKRGGRRRRGAGGCRKLD